MHRSIPWRHQYVSSKLWKLDARLLTFRRRFAWSLQMPANGRPQRPNRSHDMSEVFIPIIIVPTIMLVIGWIVRTMSTNRRLRETAKLQTEMQTKLLERFGTSQDMLQFLASDAG